MKGDETMKNMSKLAYHYGIKMRIYPSYEQCKLITLNGNISRTVYNKLVAIDSELYRLRKTRHHQDYYKLIDYLMNQKHVSYDFAQFMIDNHYVSDKTIKKAKSKHCYAYIGDSSMVINQQRINQLEARKNMRNLSNHYVYMQNKDIDSLAKANASQNHQKAWNMYQNLYGSGIPQFHKKTNSVKYQTNCQYTKDDKMTLFSGTACFLDEKHIKLPKLGRLRISGSNYRKFLKRDDIRIGTITIQRDNTNCYYVSMQLGSDNPFVNQTAFTNQQIGIDLNTDNFLTTSDGKTIDNPRYYKRKLKRLKSLQRVLSRKQRRAEKEHRNLHNSKNYQKQRMLIAKLQKHIADQRLDFVNRNVTKLVNNHDLLVAEQLQSKNMLKNHALAQSISDVGWRLFLQKLTTKGNLLNKQVVLVSPKDTTQMCSECGYICGSDNQHQKLTLKDRKWTCPNCHRNHVRDVNAAINILNKGLATLV